MNHLEPDDTYLCTQFRDRVKQLINDHKPFYKALELAFDEFAFKINHSETSTNVYVFTDASICLYCDNNQWGLYKN